MSKCLKCNKPVVYENLCRSHFINYFEDKVRKTIRKYKILDRNEKIAVAVSGGKDSTAVLYLLKKLGYNVTGFTVDAVIGNYTRKNLENLRAFCKKNKIELFEISFSEEFGMTLCGAISILKEKGYDYHSCMVCGVLRRYLINKYVRNKKYDKVVTGHNLDDEAQSFVMNIFRKDVKLTSRQGIMPGMVRDKNFVVRVKPLYFCTEKEVETYSKLMKFPVKYGECPCASDSFRFGVKQMLNDLEKKYPSVKYNIINYFLEIQPLLQKGYKVDKKELDRCKECGEPCNQDLCKACSILKLLRKN